MDIRGILITSNITAFGILLALMWKDVLTETLKQILPSSSGLMSLYMTSIIGTVFVVILAYALLKSKEINRKQLYSFRERIKIRSYKPGVIRKLKKKIVHSSNFKYKYRPKQIILLTVIEKH